MRYLKTFNEMIKVPIKVGDTVLGGRFKNKKTVVKKIGKNDKGDITINDKPLLKYRIVKESASYDDLKNNVEDYLAHLKDDGFMTETGNVKVGTRLIPNDKPNRDNFYVRVWSPQRPVDNDGSSESWLSYRYGSAGEFTWSQIEDEVNRFISIALEEWNLDYLYVIKDTVDGSTFMRQQFTLDELFNLPSDFKIKSLMIGLGNDIDKLDESTVSTFSQDIRSLIPKSIDLINSGQHKLELKDLLLNGDLIQIVYYHNTFEKSGDALGDGEPNYLEIDIHTVKDNDGTEANPDTLRLNVDITYGDSMMFSFTIDKDNGLNVHHYDGINSKYDPESKFYFSDDTIKDLVEFFNRFDDYQLTPKDFTFLDSDPNSYQPNL
jgi:hypothetical protein